MSPKEIVKLLPFSPPFLFVDELTEVDENGVKGNYTYRNDEYFYKGHFKDFPVTPGVILTETMAQIGVICLGIYLFRDELMKSGKPLVALTSTDVEFLAPVEQGEKVTVTSQKEYFRFNKLKCRVEMINEVGKLVCRGSIAGMIIYNR
ncbi:MAG TPA: hydroxymyristoyl-ACP dehydratase [Ferruginibacter sp.]|nr:hydroxymyristoyl-ACP dehydratase [Ferruginibacter sp.]